tara:strand:- start:1195 stop:1824 length:630 start_codon:yes stop_codon:yes gene_type:complete
MTYRLFYFPSSSALPVHMLLQHVGADYELIGVDRAAGDLAGESYRALNPYGQVPALIVDGRVCFETAALLTIVAERHPHAGMIPAVGSHERARFLQWLAALSANLQPVFMTYFYPERWLDDGAGQAALKRRAAEKLTALFAIVDADLGDGPFVLGQRLSAADFYLYMLTWYGRGLMPPAASLANLGRHHAAVEEIDAVVEVMRQQGLCD